MEQNLTTAKYALHYMIEVKLHSYCTLHLHCSHLHKGIPSPCYSSRERDINVKKQAVGISQTEQQMADTCWKKIRPRTQP